MTPFYFYKSTTSLAICGFSFTLMVSLGFYANRLDNEIDHLQHRLTALNKSVARSRETATFIQAHRQDFAAFEACQFERPLVPETLQASLQHPINFGAVSSLSGGAENNKVVAQDVSFSIPCLRDRDVFSLLEQLIDQGPGLFQIRNVTIRRVSHLNEETLEKIAAGKLLALFDGRITATWIHQ